MRGTALSLEDLFDEGLHHPAGLSKFIKSIDPGGGGSKGKAEIKQGSEREGLIFCSDRPLHCAPKRFDVFKLQMYEQPTSEEGFGICGIEPKYDQPGDHPEDVQNILPQGDMLDNRMVKSVPEREAIPK